MLKLGVGRDRAADPGWPSQVFCTINIAVKCGVCWGKSLLLSGQLRWRLLPVVVSPRPALGSSCPLRSHGSCGARRARRRAFAAGDAQLTITTRTEYFTWTEYFTLVLIFYYYSIKSISLSTHGSPFLFPIPLLGAGPGAMERLTDRRRSHRAEPPKRGDEGW